MRLGSVLASSPNESGAHIVFRWGRVVTGSLGERLLASRGPGSDRRGGDDAEKHESACGEEEAEGQRLIQRAMAGDEVVGPARCDRRQDGESKRSADLLGCVDEA